jgi:regulatory protein
VRITAIEPQKTRKERFNLFVDGQFATGISLESLLVNSLKVDQQLTSQELEKIISKEELTKLFDKVLHFLSYRPRSEKEIKDYLTKKISQEQKISFSEAKESLLIKKISDKLKKYKYINDEEFSKWLISSIVLKKKGPRAARVEFIKKGLPKDIVDEALSKFPNQKEIAKKAIEKKLKLWQKLSNLDFKKKVYRYLASRGFDWEIIKEVFASISKKG